MQKIKPCPFCGHQPKMINRGTGWSMLACENQECYVKPALGVSDGEPDPDKRVIDFWNNRRRIAS